MLRLTACTSDPGGDVYGEVRGDHRCERRGDGALRGAGDARDAGQRASLSRGKSSPFLAALSVLMWSSNDLDIAPQKSDDRH